MLVMPRMRRITTGFRLIPVTMVLTMVDMLSWAVPQGNYAAAEGDDDNEDDEDDGEGDGDDKLILRMIMMMTMMVMTTMTTNKLSCLLN